MSTEDLHGRVRVDTTDASAASEQSWGARLRRPHWLWTLAATPLLAVSTPAPERAEAGPAPEVGLELAETAPVAPSLPLQVNAQVERWLNAYETRRNPELTRMLSRRGLYADMIQAKLRERGMPEELLSIALIESGLYPDAVSRVSAVGVWQFMSPTATQYGLRIDEFVDERRDPVRATDAALDYLQWLHDRFGGSWYLAAAAFNAGPGRLERVLNLYSEGPREDDVYWEVREHLPRETREYVPKLIAVTIMANRADRAGFHAPGVEPVLFDTVYVPDQRTLASVARSIGVGTEILRALNPHLVRGVTPPGEVFPVRIPADISAAMAAAFGPPAFLSPSVD